MAQYSSALAPVPLQFNDPTVSHGAAFRALVESKAPSDAIVTEAKRMRAAPPPFGAFARRFTLARLVAEVAPALQSGDPSDRQAELLEILGAEIADAAVQPNSVGLMSNIFDCCPPGSETLLPKLLTSKPAGLSPLAQVAVLVACSHASTPTLKTAARNLLARRVEEATHSLSGEALLDALAATMGGAAPTQVIAAIAAEAVGDPASDPHAAFIRLCDAVGVSAAPLTLLPSDSAICDAASRISVPSTVGDAVAAAAATVSPAQLLKEFGPVALATDDAAVSFVSLLPDACTTALNVAGCLGIMMEAAPARPDNGCWSSVRTSMVGKPSSLSPPPADTSWGVERFVSALANANINWDDVLVALAETDFSPEAPEKISVVITAYKAATGNAPSLLAILGGSEKPTWRSPSALRAVLQHLATQLDMVDCPPASRCVPLAVAANYPGWSALWSFIDVVEVVLRNFHRAPGALTEMMKQAIAQGSGPAAVLVAAVLSAKPVSSAGTVQLAVALILSAGVSASLPEDGVRYIVGAGGQQQLLATLGEYLTGESSRMATLLGVLTQHSLFSPLLDVVTDPSIFALVAITGLECDQVGKRILPNAMTSGSSAQRVTLAMAVVQVVETLLGGGAASPISASTSQVLTMGSFSPAVREALEAVVNAHLDTVIPATVDHAKALLAAAPPPPASSSPAPSSAVASPTASSPTGAASGSAPQLDPSSAPLPPEMERAAMMFMDKMYQDDKFDALQQCILMSQQVQEKPRQLLQAIVKLVLDEAKCVVDYPTRELNVFANFFGRLVEANLMGTKSLQDALRIVLHSVARPSSNKVRDFGIIALSAFRARVPEWPQYGKQLRMIPDIDMQIPGIIALLSRPADAPPSPVQRQRSILIKLPPPNTKAPGPDTPGTPAEAITASGGGPNLHQHDIRTLIDPECETVAPSSLVQGRINFIVSNTDPSKIDESARDLRELLTPDRYLHFADYFVVKRISLEPNNHKMYLQLLDRMGLPELDEKVTTAAITACKRLLESPRVRTLSSDRSLLKSLGAWIGQSTLARNIPLLAREFDLVELIPLALAEGKLIAVVPFVAKIIECGVQGRAFRWPNPWTAAVLAQMVELYHLPDLKITLRFEVELLCKNIGVSLHEIIERTKERPPHRFPLVELKNRYVDVDNSFDFRPSQPPDQGGVSVPNPRSAGPGTRLQADAMPYQPKEVAPSSRPGLGMTPSPNPQEIPPGIAGYGQRVHAEFAQEPDYIVEARPSLELPHIPSQLASQYRATLQHIVLRTLQDTQTNVERTVVIACTTAHELVVKDFCNEPDNNVVGRAAANTARSLAANVIASVGREGVSNSLRRGLQGSIGTFLPPPLHTNEVLESIVTSNIDVCLSALEQRVGQVAIRTIEAQLASWFDERTRCIAAGARLPVPRDHLEPSVQEFLPTLPEAVRPAGPVTPAHVEAYTEFNLIVGRVDPSIDQIRRILDSVEEHAHLHYQECPPSQPKNILSLTDVSFTKDTLSNYHFQIRSHLIDVNQHITETNAAPLLTTLFPRIIQLAEEVQSDPTHSTLQHTVTLLLHEVCLFVLQAARDKGGARAVQELTRLFLSHPRRWENKELAANVIRLHVIDIHEFDKALQVELNNHRSNHIVEFAGHIVRKCLIDDQLTTPKELDNTLKALDRIASANRERRTVVHVPSGVTADAQRETVKQFFAEWIGMTQKRSSMKQEDFNQKTLQFIHRLQQEGMLRSDGGLDRFFALGTEHSVERYATVCIQLERTNICGNSGPVALTTTPPNLPAARSRMPQEPRLFEVVDSFVDLIAVLVKCCSVRDGSSQKEGGVALVGRLLGNVSKVLLFNHDAFVDGAEKLPAAPQGTVMQDSFMQQPYLRLFSGLIINFGQDDSNSALDLYTVVANVLNTLNPLRAPGFAFAWLELMGHRILIGRMLRVQAGWPAYFKLLHSAIRFIGTLVSARDAQSQSPAPAHIFKSVLKLLVLLLHDFPDFLLAYHQPLCDVIPSSCVQMRNVVLSAFPKSMKLPDPFLPTLKVETLPDMQKPPTLVASVLDFFNPGPNGAPAPIPRDVTTQYLTHKTPADFPQRAVEAVCTTGTNRQFNVPLLNGLVLYGCVALRDISPTVPPSQLCTADSPVVTLFREMLSRLSSEGRYHFIGACVNQLRFPNSFTHFFSCLLLMLYEGAAPVDRHANLQEIITRVLAERLTVTRPHPWGLLITFIEMARNKKYDFINKPFVRADSQIEKMFQRMTHLVQTRPSNSVPADTEVDVKA